MSSNNLILFSPKDLRNRVIVLTGVLLIIGLVALLWRSSLRFEYHNDPRQKFDKKQQNYIIALLHAHTIGGTLTSTKHAAVMASRSKDGDFISPTLRLVGMKPIRGSTQSAVKAKGGKEALAATFIESIMAEYDF